MGWFNLFGLVFVVVLIIPTILYASRDRSLFVNHWHNKPVQVLEQIGRFGCLATMVFNIPGTWMGFASNEAFATYLLVDFVLVVCYSMVWAICWQRPTVTRAVLLSTIPSVLFLFSAIMSQSLLLLISSLIFAPSHIVLSVKNARATSVGA